MGLPAVLAVVLAVVAPGAAPAGAADQPVASGRFTSRGVSFEVGGAYAYRSRSSFGDEPIIDVVVSNAEIRASYVDQWLDRGQFFEQRIKDANTAVINFEFSPDGAFKGISYQLGSGNGCGYCSGPQMKSTVKLVGGRLSGTLSAKEKDRSWDIKLDLPVASDDHGPALPAGGGEVGKAYLAYAAAVKARDVAAIRKLLTARMVEAMDRAERRGDLEGFVTALGEDRYVDSVKVEKGFASADTAVLAVSGTGDLGKRAGQVLLRKEKGGWRVEDEILGTADAAASTSDPEQ